MFLTKTPDERVYAIKPMNCPGHVQVFRQGLHSYRELPIRYAEFGKVHRYEPSGALHGLLRVRAFTQDDAHVFVTEDQITEETVRGIELMMSIYRDFGFDDVRVKFADRPARRVGDDDTWARAEEGAEGRGAARRASSTSSIRARARSTGPKLEFVLKDAIGRDWQCGTWQVDLNLPGAARRALHRRAQPEAHARHAAPRDLRLARALLRHPARALRRPVARLARAGAGGRAEYQRKAGRICTKSD